MADQIIGPLTISSKQCDEPNVKLTKPLIRVRTDLFSSPTPSTDQIQTPFEMIQENGDAETNQENVQDKGDFTVPIASFTYPPPQVQSLEKEFEKLRINKDSPSLRTPVVSSWYSEYPFSATSLASNLTTPSTQENPWEAVSQQSWTEFFADFELKLGNKQRHPPCQEV